MGGTFTGSVHFIWDLLFMVIFALLSGRQSIRKGNTQQGCYEGDLKPWHKR